MKEVLKKLILKKSADDNKSIKNYPACKELFTCTRLEIIHSAMCGFGD